MKKLVSLMALCTVLLGAVALGGCGTKPAKGSVWKMTKATAEGKTVPLEGVSYYCFHSDGYFYTAAKVGKLPLAASKNGKYTINAKTITIEGWGTALSYTIKGNKMTLKHPEGATYELEKVSAPTEDEIKKAVVKQ